MLLATVDNWTLETFHNGMWTAYVNNPARDVVGMGAGFTEEAAIKDAMRAWNTTRKPLEAALLAAYRTSQPTQ